MVRTGIVGCSKHVCCLALKMFLIVNEGYVQVALPKNETDAQRNAQCDMRKKDQKALFYIHQCVDMNVFERIVDLPMKKVVWDTLVWCYDDDASVKKVKLQSLYK